MRETLANAVRSASGHVREGRVTIASATSHGRRASCLILPSMRVTSQPGHSYLHKCYLLMLRSNVVLLSFAAPSTAGFVGISPKGRGMDAARR
jgi:hypothetical protein